MEMLFNALGSLTAVCKRSSFLYSQSELPVSISHLVLSSCSWSSMCSAILMTFFLVSCWRYFLFLSDSTKKKMEAEVDEYSDSFFSDISIEEIKLVWFWFSYPLNNLICARSFNSRSITVKHWASSWLANLIWFCLFSFFPFCSFWEI